MESVLVKWLLLGNFMILPAQIYGSKGWIEEERMSPLQIKASIPIDRENNIDGKEYLPSWVDDPNSDYCEWEGVTCNSTTSHVIHLSLYNISRIQSYYHPYFDEINYDCEDYKTKWSLNFSIFRQFEELTSLNLSFNRIGSEGLERFSKLNELEVLDLSHNCLDSKIISSMVALTSLKVLFLQFNEMEGPIPTKYLAKLKILETLDLSHNGFNSSLLKVGDSELAGLINLRVLRLRHNRLVGTLPLQMFSTFTNLEILDLGGNSLAGSVPENMWAPSSLKALILSRNYLNGSLLGFCKMKRLEKLDLSDNSFEGNILPVCLLNLTSLRYLDLSFNQFTGHIPSNDLERLPSLNKLEVLNLSSNGFDSKIFRSIGALTSLKVLILDHNGIEGSIPTKELAGLISLRVLRLGYNGLNGTLPLQMFSTFTNLEILDLRGNSLAGRVPESMWIPYSLKALSLSHNHLNGSLLSFCEMERLEELDLSFNNFGGNLLVCLLNLTSLRYLDLSFNQFTGHIPPNINGSLKSLEYIDLSKNLFEGLFSFKTFANNSKLEVVVLDCDNKMKVESKYPGWVPSFQLKYLSLPKCGLDDIPEFFLYQFRLAILDLSHNKIEARFPNWLIENNTGLVSLSLENNSFNGQIQVIGEKIFPIVTYLNLSRNSIEGYFPFSPSEGCNLWNLDLSFNKFSGEVPEKLLSTCTSMGILKLDHNKFNGQVFTSRFNLTELRYLDLSHNKFVGTLSSLNTKFSFLSLELFNLRNNCFHGEIPSGLISSTYLRIVDFSHNLFEGEIPCELLSAWYSDLSHNSFSRVSPSCFNRDDIGPSHVNLQANKLSGSFPEVILNLSTLQTLNLRENNFSGIISDSFVAFQDLRILLLGGNHFDGIIPNWLCELNDLSLLDLSKNTFVGYIPQCLGNLSILSFRSQDTYNVFEKFENQGGIGFVSYMASLLGNQLTLDYSNDINVEVEVEFVTKNMALTYKGDILNYMSGLDLVTK